MHYLVLWLIFIATAQGKVSLLGRVFTAGNHGEGAFELDLTVNGVNFKTFWDSTWHHDIRDEAYKTVCPALAEHAAAMDSPLECDEVVRVVHETFENRREWGVADYAVRYEDIVYAAVHNDEEFKVFKSDIRYRSIVESLDGKHAFEYLREAYSQSPHFFYDPVYVDRVTANDAYGAPERLAYGLPSTQGAAGDLIHLETGCSIIRYMKVVSDLHLMMDVLKDPSIQSIAEIGIGFGGQAQVLLSHPAISPPPGTGPGRVVDYYFFDIPIVRQLAAKYLSKFPWLDQHRLHFMDSDWDTVGPDTDAVFDLCISSYAISEFSVDLQDRYIATVLKRCRRGYILYNIIGQQEIGSYSVQQFAEKVQEQNLFSPFVATQARKEYPGDSAHVSSLYYWIGSPTP